MSLTARATMLVPTAPILVFSTKMPAELPLSLTTSCWIRTEPLDDHEIFFIGLVAWDRICVRFTETKATNAKAHSGDYRGAISHPAF
jgi:hypothetical protein